MTYKEMCETISEADFLRTKTGTNPTAEQIFNYSPTGELSNIHFWYEDALAILERNSSLGSITAGEYKKVDKTFDPPVELPKGKSVFNPETGEVNPYKEDK